MVGISQTNQKTDNPEINFKEKLHSFEKIQVLLHRTFATTIEAIRDRKFWELQSQNIWRTSSLENRNYSNIWSISSQQNL